MTPAETRDASLADYRMPCLSCNVMVTALHFHGMDGHSWKCPFCDKILKWELDEDFDRDLHERKQ